MSSGLRLLLVGCGKMGGALLRGVQAAALASEVCVVEPSLPKSSATTDASVLWVDAPEKLPPAFMPDLIVLAVKPQQMAAVLPAYARYTDSVFLSIAAGVTMTRLRTLLGGGALSIVRTMPNLPASIGVGMSVAVANPFVKPAQREAADALLKAVGVTAWIEREDQLDAVTALSGSGPAYVFALCEAMAAAGEFLGLPAPMAATLARQTIVGSGALLGQSTEPAADLRRAVTSPGGTTEAALNHLLASGGLPDLMRKAMMAAAQRAKELSQ